MRESPRPKGDACVAPTTALSPWGRFRVRTVHATLILTLTARTSWTRWHMDTPRLYRGNASLTPPSTGSMLPVVFDERSLARNNAASATSSAVTCTPSKLRRR